MITFFARSFSVARFVNNSKFRLHLQCEVSPRSNLKWDVFIGISPVLNILCKGGISVICSLIGCLNVVWKVSIDLNILWHIFYDSECHAA